MFRHHHLFQRLCQFVLFVCCFLANPLFASAQGADRQARAAQWDGYALPDATLKRIVDRQKGYLLWVPAEWKESQTQHGRVFAPESEGVNLQVITEEIPEGYGIANYATATLQGLRGQPLRPETLTVRRVWLGGLEWREVSYDLTAAGGVVIHQTMWLTVHGPRAYGFALSFQPPEREQHEPLFKRILLSTRILAAGNWTAAQLDEFENLRARFDSGAAAAPRGELEAAQIAEAIRTAREPVATSVKRLTEFFNQAPAAALDMLLDISPQVRSAAIAALGQRAAQTPAPHANEALLWALQDKDTLASTTAAQALTALGPATLTTIKPKLPALAETPAALVRLGATLGEPAARELAEELLRSESGKQQLAALQLALILPRLNFSLPYARLLASSEANVAHATIAVIQRQRPAEAAAELLKLLRGETEMWAARALGEVGAPELASRFEARVAEIDKRLGTIVVDANKKAKASKKSKLSSSKDTSVASFPSAAELKGKPEEVRLALARGELTLAFNKLKLRERWQQAKDEAARRALFAEIDKEQAELSEWARATFKPVEAATPAAVSFDPAKLKDAPSTGETVFPANTLSYVQAPNFAATLDKLDAALAGVQMATVRDQMTLALLLNRLKAGLAERFGTQEASELSAALGLDLKAPIALATWPDAETKGDARHGIVLRVTDQARFERLLAAYQHDFGNLDTLTIATAVLSRAAGILPAAVPVIFTAVAAGEMRGSLITKPVRALASAPAVMPALTCVRQERINDLPVAVFEKQQISALGKLQSETIYLAYLGQTALLASSRAALLDLLRTGSAQTALGQTEAYTRTRRAPGELVFFSQLGEALKQLATWADAATGADAELLNFLKAFGVESGALRLTPTAWETDFNLALADNKFSHTFKPFKVADLAAPRELLPRGTILYAGAVIDPPALWKAMKSLEESSKSPVKQPEKPKDEKQKARDSELERDVEKIIIPQLQGEIAAALLSFKPLFDKGDSEWPALIFAAKLKNKELAALHNAGKLFASFTRVPDTKVFDSAVVALGADDDAPFLVVNEHYLIIADSVATLRLLEAQDNFADARDFVRSAQAVPDNLALFATYNLTAAFEEARGIISGSQSEGVLPLVSAITHAFHSQHAFVTLTPDGLQGRLAVAFDREGRYAVGSVAQPSGEFDVANALIAPKGLRVLHAPRIEALTVRALAKQPGIAPRVREDLSKFAWQRVESSDDRTIVFTSTARRIPTNQTIKLPVVGAEFEPYLKSGHGIYPQAPEIKALAKQIAGNETDGHSIARKLGEWTFGNLKWKKVQSDTLETLASREADCLEHSELYVALARALGLPARVVIGAALSGGAFGAHAWVEVYLGKWVELDPTWGLMEHVDATHLRFDGNAFADYAMLNQLELEIVTARAAVAEYQRDPLKLVKAFGTKPELRETAFDLALTAEQALGAGAWDKLDEKQRAAVIAAFDRAVTQSTHVFGQLDVADNDPAELVGLETRILQSEINGARATITGIHFGELLRFHLVARDGAWFISEIEDLDASLPKLADALRGALHPGQGRAQLDDLAPEAAIKQLDALIAKEGEKPELLLHKARLLESQRSHALIMRLSKAQEEKAQPKESLPEPPLEPITELYRQIAARWPAHAPAHYALGHHLSLSGDADEAKRKEAIQRALAPLQRYAQLMPYDTRVWLSLASTYESLDQLSEAESAYRTAIEREPTYLAHRTGLLIFHLTHQQSDKAKLVFGEMLKAALNPEAAFAELHDEEEWDEEQYPQLEALLLAFPKELSASKSGLLLLAEAQQGQEKTAAAIKTMQRVIALKAEADDYSYLAQLLRKARRFAETVTAATQAIKLSEHEGVTAMAYFERACARAQLGLKKAALADLEQVLKTDAVYAFEAEDADLKPLAALPEFKALVEKAEKLYEEKFGGRVKSTPVK
jgi:tetratricopeptide (TPR) repeat protein